MKKLNSKRRIITIDNFSSFDADCNLFSENKLHIKKIYNFAHSNGILKNSKGFEAVSFPRSRGVGVEEITLDVASLGLTSIEGLMNYWEYSSTYDAVANKLIIYGNDKYIYRNILFQNYATFSNIYSLRFNKCPVALNFKKNGRDAVLFSSESDTMVVWTADLAPYVVVDIPKITTMCDLDGVLFCSVGGEAKSVYYTTTLDPQYIGGENGGSIFLGGELGRTRKVVSFKGYVYAFREYGITKLTYYDNSNIKVDNLYCSPSIIFANTVSVCGDVIYFLSRDGIYAFNGSNVEKLDLSINSIVADVDNANAVGDSLQSKYYLACRVDFGDSLSVLSEAETGWKNNCLLIIDGEKGDVEVVRGIDINHMMALKDESVEKMLFTFNTLNKDKVAQICDSGKFFNANMPKFMETNKLVLNDENDCAIRKLEVVSDANVTIKLICDNETLTFTTSQNGKNVFDLMTRTKTVKIGFETIDNVVIKKLQMTVVNL